MKIQDTNKIVLNIEASEKGCAFYAIYAGLRMYKESKSHDNISAAEAFCILGKLEEDYPEDYAEAESEYNESKTK